MLDQFSPQYTPEEIESNREKIQKIYQGLRQKLVQIDSEPFDANSAIFQEGIYKGIFVDAAKIGYPQHSSDSVFMILKELSKKTTLEILAKIESIAEILVHDRRFEEILKDLTNHYFDASTPNILHKGFPTEIPVEQLVEMLKLIPRLSEGVDIQTNLMLSYFTNDIFQIDILNSHSGLTLSREEWKVFFTMLAYNMQDDAETAVVVGEYKAFLEKNQIVDSFGFTITISEALTEIADVNKAASDNYAKDLYLNACRNSLQFKLQMLMIS